jgi:hypothetical protein
MGDWVSRPVGELPRRDLEQRGQPEARGARTLARGARTFVQEKKLAGVVLL